jgi:hypothetical protein
MTHATQPFIGNGNYMYHLFKILKLCILLTQCIYLFRMILTINRNFLSEQH